MNPMTDEELKIEMDYRIQERLGILCGAAEPTPEQLKLATAEADQWLADYFRQQADTLIL
jgi:hypothetical protein